MSDFTFRKMEPRDIPDYVSLRIQQLAEEGADTGCCDLSPHLSGFYQRHLTDGSFVSWLAQEDNQIIGTSGLSFVEKPPYYGNLTGKIGILSNMYTVREFRRRGIAKKLLGLIAAESRLAGCGTIHVTASDDGVHLYTNFGFQKNQNFMQLKL